MSAVVAMMKVIPSLTGERPTVRPHPLQRSSGIRRPIINADALMGEVFLRCHKRLNIMVLLRGICKGSEKGAVQLKITLIPDRPDNCAKPALLPGKGDTASINASMAGIRISRGGL